MADPVPISLAPAEAVKHFIAKGFAFGFAWQDVWQGEHARAFTVAKAMSRDVLETIRDAVEKAIADGETLATFRKELRPRLEALGWWGRQPMRDPLTGTLETVQLGSPRRLKTIFEVNLRTSYAAGRWERVWRNRAAFPMLEYVSVKDGREREEHGAWHGTRLPVEHVWWNTHYPPNGWNCRCIVKPVSAGRIARLKLGEVQPVRFKERQWVNKRTGEVHRIEDGIDPGWAYHVGRAPMEGLTPDPFGGSGDDLAAQSAAFGSALSGSDEKLLTPFFAAFDIKGRAAMVRGKTVIDAGGWPLAISASWFHDGDGELRLPTSLHPRQLAAVAATLNAPDEIRWHWLAGPPENGKPGRAQLVRRYIGPVGSGGFAMVVDVARWWRAGFVPGARLAQARRGSLAWSAELGLAAYDPSQPRHVKGARGAGRWRSTGRSAARASLLGDGSFFPKAIMGYVGDDVAGRAAAQGIDIRGRGVVLTHTAVVHVQKSHGVGSERRRDQVPVKPRDFLKVAQLLNAADSFEIGKPKRNGMKRFRAVTGEFHTTWEVSKKSVLLTSMWRKREN